MRKTLLLSIFALGMVLPALGQFSIKKVVFEEFTGAWCQYCADGAYRAHVMDSIYPDALPVAVHNGDAMEILAGTDLATFYGPAYPQALFDRGGALVSRGSWNSTMANGLSGAGLVTVAFDNVTYNDQTRLITADVSAQFTGVSSGDFRINMIVTEDHVTGSGSGYNQVNADNSTPGHPYQGAGNPIVGFHHMHVAREYIEGPWGLAGVIDSTVHLGSYFTHTFTYTVPANFNVAEMALVAYVGRYDGPNLGDRQILNGEEFVLAPLVVGTPNMTSDESRIEVVGNPLTDRSKIVFANSEAGNVRVEVLNLAGQRVAVLGDDFATKGIHTIVWDGRNAAGSPVSNGMYLVRMVEENGHSLSTRIMVAR